MTTNRTEKDTLDFTSLLHPAQAYGHPCQVLADSDLTIAEKRAILASWASDACAVEVAPELREPSPGNTVKFDEIMDALRSLDKQATVRPDYAKLLSRAQRVKEFCWKNNGVLRTERRTQ
jgi:hypothetical protein